MFLIFYYVCVVHVTSCLVTDNHDVRRVFRGELTYSQKHWVGCAARFPKFIPCLRPKSVIFLTLLTTHYKFDTPF